VNKRRRKLSSIICKPWIKIRSRIRIRIWTRISIKWKSDPYGHLNDADPQHCRCPPLTRWRSRKRNFVMTLEEKMRKR
jgi:hypothetical protein